MTNEAYGEMMPITHQEFVAIRDLVYERFGISLSDQKKSLVVSRLQKILRQRGFQNFKQYYDTLIADKTDKAISELANQITTNHTFFFREADHFDFFTKTILPEMTARHREQNNNDLRIWCAAASSGEEPYTIIIAMLEYFGANYSQWNAGLLCTDISEKALVEAKKAVYEKTRLQGVPPAILQKYFKQEGDQWSVVEKVKKEAVIRRFNLMNKTLPFKKPFDCIWCRNVMIYFDMETKIELAKRMYNHTVNGGYLLIGHSETLGRDQTKWKYVKPAVYIKEE
ncbi:MAG: protein-glutamate O-methyltransferase CheR [Planctomycetaceae bacterium]|nr:protein-glutamate O-methyltransferase CheR [Planctomycetaceae bacterium]